MHNIRLANITGLDTSNAQHSVAIDEALIGIDDKEAFLDYCRDHKEGTRYATKTERLDTLATKFKKLQASAKLPHDLANTFSQVLCEKVSTARAFLKNEIEAGNEKPFSRLRTNGESYFTKKELSALSELKISHSSIIGLSENGTLVDALINLFMSKLAIKSTYAHLTDNQNKIQTLIQGIKQ